MLRKVILISATTLMLIGCESPSASDDAIDQRLIFIVSQQTHYYENGNSMAAPNVTIDGELISPEGVKLITFTVNDVTFMGKEYCDYTPGGVSIGYDMYGYRPRMIGNIDTVSTTIVTSHGTLTGNLSKPDQISNAVLDVSDSLNTDSTLTISWEGGDADFYTISTLYRWNSGEDRLYDFLYHFSDARSYTFPDSTFSVNGDILSMGVTPYNGPIPSFSMTPNMKGAGSGYFYYEGLRIGASAGIVVGDGFDGFPSGGLSRDHSYGIDTHKPYKGITNQIRSLSPNYSIEVE